MALPWKREKHRTTKMYKDVHRRFIFNRQKLETTQNSINLFTDKEIVVYSHNGILSRSNTEWTVETTTSRNSKNVTEQETPDIKVYTLYGFIYTKFWSRLWWRKLDYWLFFRGLTTKGHKRNFPRWWKFSVLLYSSYTNVYLYQNMKFDT